MHCKHGYKVKDDLELKWEMTVSSNHVYLSCTCSKGVYDILSITPEGNINRYTGCEGLKSFGMDIDQSGKVTVKN